MPPNWAPIIFPKPVPYFPQFTGTYQSLEIWALLESSFSWTSCPKYDEFLQFNFTINLKFDISPPPPTTTPVRVRIISHLDCQKSLLNSPSVSALDSLQSFLNVTARVVLLKPESDIFLCSDSSNGSPSAHSKCQSPYCDPQSPTSSVCSSPPWSHFRRPPTNLSILVILTSFGSFRLLTCPRLGPLLCVLCGKHSHLWFSYDQFPYFLQTVTHGLPSQWDFPGPSSKISTSFLTSHTSHACFILSLCYLYVTYIYIHIHTHFFSFYGHTCSIGSSRARSWKPQPQQCWILNSASETRDWTHIFTETTSGP